MYEMGFNTYASSFSGQKDSSAKISYAEVQERLNKGEDAIMLWRQYKGIEVEEMAAALEVSVAEYKAMETYANVSPKKMQGICWYLDVHPLDMIGQGQAVIKDHFVDALIDAYSNPRQWPYREERLADMQKAMAERLTAMADRKASYLPLAEQYGRLRKSASVTEQALGNVLETLLVNDGNPAFLIKGIQGAFNDAVAPYVERVNALKEMVVSHDQSYASKKEELNRKGKFCTDDWGKVRPMLNALYNPDFPSVVSDFLIRDVPRRRGLTRIGDGELRDLAGAYIAVRHADRFEEKKTGVLNEIKIDNDCRTGIVYFMSTHRDVLSAYERRQKILVAAPDIAVALGSPDHPCYMRTPVKGARSVLIGQYPK